MVEQDLVNQRATEQTVLVRMMLLTAGSRGDVEPFAALARYATAQGHDVRLGVPENSGMDLSGLDVVGLDVDFRRLVQTQGVSLLAAARSFRTVVRPAMGRVLSAAVRETLAFRPEVIVHHPKVLTAPAVAEALGVPCVVVELVPSVTPTRAFPAPGVVNRNLGPLNRATYAAARGAARMFRGEMEQACTPLPGRPSASKGSAPTASLVPVSPQILPRPADWPASVHLTGAWQEEGRVSDLDPAVAEFVRGGPYLVATFGSMAAGDPQARGSAVVTGARAHGLRILMLTGWGGLALPDDVHGDDVCIAAAAPLDAVLPGAALAVHHGGAGAVHTVARAGIPSVVVPFLADQPFWGRQLHGLGLAAEPVPYQKVTAARLIPAITDALGARDRAEQVGRQVRQERGLRVALDVLVAC